MTTKVKDLFKGLRYISQVFNDEKEEEIQIGFPTDVKHVAHIGWDGPAASTPSWMQDFKSGSDPPSGASPSVETKDNKSKDGGSRDSKDVPTPRSRRPSIESLPGSPTQRSSDGSKHSRRHRSSDPLGESGGTRPRRHHRHSKNEDEKTSSDAPKGSRRRKTKTSSGDGSTKSSASKGGSMTDISLPELSNT